MNILFLMIDRIQGFCDSKLQGNMNQEIEGIVEGYDEKNMWLKISNIRNID